MAASAVDTEYVYHLPSRSSLEAGWIGRKEVGGEEDTGNIVSSVWRWQTKEE